MKMKTSPMAFFLIIGLFLQLGPAQAHQVAVPKEIPSKPETIAHVHREPQVGPILTADDLQPIIEHALDKKLKPVISMLAQSQANAPAFTDIVGGIGYIIGLVGIGAYFHNRRKKD